MWITLYKLCLQSKTPANTSDPDSCSSGVTGKLQHTEELWEMCLMAD